MEPTVTTHAWVWHARAPTGATPLTATLTLRGQPATFRAVIDAWRSDPWGRPSSRLWLHVRIDSRPKYYRHRPYAEPDVGHLLP